MAKDPNVREQNVRLDLFDNKSFKRGASKWKEALWQFIQALFISSWIPGSAHRRFLLRLFGAKIGRGVVLKPGVRIKFPWRLYIDDYSWIGESCWIDNLADVKIGKHCCLSQAASLCTGNHDRRSTQFTLITSPIIIEDYAWIAAFARVGPGVTVAEGAMLGFGSTATHNLQSWGIFAGSPCVFKEKRILR